MLLLPSKLRQFLLGAYELSSAILQFNAAAPWLVIIESKQLGPAVLIPLLRD